MPNIKDIIQKVVSSGFLHQIYNLNDELVEVGFAHLGEGRHRITYLSPNKRYVLKFPTSQDGLYVNQRESHAYRRVFNQPEPNGQCYAPCRLIQNHILMMRTVVET